MGDPEINGSCNNSAVVHVREIQSEFLSGERFSSSGHRHPHILQHATSKVGSIRVALGSVSPSSDLMTSSTVSALAECSANLAS